MCFCTCFVSVLCSFVQMSPFKSSAVKGDNNKGNEHVIDVDNLSPKPKRTRSPIGIFYKNYFRSYVASQNFAKYFMEAPLLVERAIDQPSLHDTNIPIWFAIKDWNFLLSTLEDAYKNMVREFYVNAIVDGEEIKCWVRGKSFSVSPNYLAEILHIN